MPESGRGTPENSHCENNAKFQSTGIVVLSDLGDGAISPSSTKHKQSADRICSCWDDAVQPESERKDLLEAA